jgi:hypothetical protein
MGRTDLSNAVICAPPVTGCFSLHCPCGDLTGQSPFTRNEGVPGSNPGVGSSLWCPASGGKKTRCGQRIGQHKIRKRRRWSDGVVSCGDDEGTRSDSNGRRGYGAGTPKLARGGDTARCGQHLLQRRWRCSVAVIADSVRRMRRGHGQPCGAVFNRKTYRTIATALAAPELPSEHSLVVAATGSR